MAVVFIATSSATGAPLAGLSPTWNAYVNASSGAAVSQPTISAVGNGHYKFTPTAGTEIAGVIDCGSTALPRYIHFPRSEIPTFVAWNSSGAPLTGLTPTWNAIQDVDAAAAYTPQPAIAELGTTGIYRTTQILSHHVSGVIDFGATAYPRYTHYDSGQLRSSSSAVTTMTANVNKM